MCRIFSVQEVTFFTKFAISNYEKVFSWMLSQWDYCELKIKVVYSHVQTYGTTQATRRNCRNHEILLGCIAINGIKKKIIRYCITLTCFISCVTFSVLTNDLASGVKPGVFPQIWVFNAFSQIWFYFWSRASERNFSRGTKTDTGPLASGSLVETCIVCLYSDQNIDKTATTLRLRNILIVVLATGLH